MMIELIYWDSDTFLSLFQEEEGKFEYCRGTFERAKNGELVIVTSTLTLAEVLWMRNAPKITEDKALILRRFFRHSYIRLHAVTRSVAELAQELVWDHSVKPKDAIHLATAFDRKITILETFDKNLLTKSITVDTHTLVIRKPIPPKQGRLI
jgi:predicted nucleic acid-binding protein